MVDGLAPWPKNFRPTPGQFGAMFQTLSVALATAGPALVGTATTSIYIGIPRSKTVFVTGASLQGATAYTGSAAVTATLIRSNNQSDGQTDVALTGAADLTAALDISTTVNVPITATEDQATCLPGDTLRVDVGIAGTFGTAGTGRFVVEIAVIN